MGDASGLINSIGLQNPGVQHFIDVELGEMLELKQKYGTVAIANLGGHRRGKSTSRAQPC